jgi:hypothetical protein
MRFRFFQDKDIDLTFESVDAIAFATRTWIDGHPPSLLPPSPPPPSPPPPSPSPSPLPEPPPSPSPQPPPSPPPSRPPDREPPQPIQPAENQRLYPAIQFQVIVEAPTSDAVSILDSVVGGGHSLLQSLVLSEAYSRRTYWFGEVCLRVHSWLDYVSGRRAHWRRRGRLWQRRRLHR